ncbi:unnamed protein product [Callosobruchus maculatus]|uniref:Uncharacterized protein n=1 Tax=Callosobruchus maculatus TaxID=64391 RepID=A0A653CXW3_CALMS|nr:unnamed protein product [Callosobruchus maculatus]
MSGPLKMQTFNRNHIFNDTCRCVMPRSPPATLPARGTAAAAAVALQSTAVPAIPSAVHHHDYDDYDCGAINTGHVSFEFRVIPRYVKLFKTGMLRLDRFKLLSGRRWRNSIPGYPLLSLLGLK